MKARQQTTWLLGAVLAVGALDAASWWLSRPEMVPEPPGLAPFDASRADVVRLGRIDEPLVLQRHDGEWIIAPQGVKADPGEVELLLAELADGVRGELALEDSPENLEKYGLSGGTELRVDVEGAGAVLSSLYVGNDAGGGTTWIRLPDDDQIAQARIGGRARYERQAGTLRDRRLVALDPAEVETLALRSRDQTLLARKQAGGWEGEPAPDDPTLEELVRALSAVRAVEVIPQAEADPRIDWTFAEVTLGTDQGETVLQFGRAETFRYARRVGSEDIGRIQVPWVDRLAQPHSFADKSLWAVDRIDAIALRAPGRDGLLEREGEAWVMRRPAHVDIEPNQLQAVLSFLARPRVIAWDPGAAGFGSEHVWTVRTSQGTQVLELGAIEGERIAVRAGGRTGWLDLRVVRIVEGLFGG